jgi:hypothetical protein
MDALITDSRGRRVGFITLSGGPYKPGDQPPSGYCDWDEWAAIQYKAGLRQRRCARCGKYRFPQEIASDGQKPECKECGNG